MNQKTVPTTRRTLLRVFVFCSLWLGPSVLLLTPLTAPAQTPAPPTGGYPSASRLQEVYARGQDAGYGSFKAESNFGQGPAPGAMDYQLESSLRNQSPDLSPIEREVFTDGFRKGADKADRGMTKIDPPKINVQGSDTSSTTTITGKTPAAEPGTLQLTDKDGNSYFVDVDANGNYKKIVPQADFQPVKATLWTKNGKLVRAVKADGTWTVVSSAAGTSPGGAAAYALLDECNRAVLRASLASETQTVSKRPDDLPPRNQSSIHLIRLFSGARPIPDHPRPPVRRVNDPLPPDLVREAHKQGFDHADQQFEKMQLDKIPEGNRTQAQKDRLKELNRMIQEFEDGQKLLRGPNNKFVSKELIQAADIAQDTAKARWLQRQAEALRNSGDPNLQKQAADLDAQAKKLLGGQDPPPLRASAQEPLQFSSAQTQGGTADRGTRLVAAGQSGYALANAAASLASGNTPQVVKGHTTQVATADIRRQQETGIELDPLVHLEENERNETVSFPGYFGYNLSTQSWGKPDFSLAAIWTGSDPNPPVVASIASDGTFAIKDAYSFKPCLKLNAAIGYDHVSTPIDGAKLGGDYHVTFNRNPTWIAGFKTGVNIDQFQQDYMQGGAVNHSQYTWTHWHTPFTDVPMISSGQISDEGYNHLSWTKPYKDFMVYGELSPGTNPQPLPGLDPTDWPSAAAAPLPTLSLSGSWLEEEARR